MLLVVSVVSGVNFPKRDGHLLLAEARFDGEILGTDPVPHEESPEIEQEIAWELSKKSLQHHRLHRTSIKLQLYAVDATSTAREMVGYVVLDVRAATSAKSSKWYQLLHCKYTQNKCQLHVGIYIDEESNPQEMREDAADVPNTHEAPPAVVKSKTPPPPEEVRPPAPLSKHPTPVTHEEPSHSQSASYLLMPHERHHFCCSIELQSIHDLQLEGRLSVHCRYSYGFFGSVAPVITRPSVEVKKFQEVTLPQGYCAFEFAATPDQTEFAFSSQPLVVQVFNSSSDEVLGCCSVPLSSVFQHPNRKCSSVFPILSSNNTKIADLSVLIQLEDFGLIKEPHVHVPVSKEGKTKEVSPGDEYKAAMELELWKEAVQAEFEQSLRLKEASHMRALAEEWRRRDGEREQLVKKKLDEYAALEADLRKAAADVEKRERQVAGGEREIARLKADLQREHSRKLAELRDASGRLEADCKQKVEAEKARTRQLEEQLAQAKAQSCEWERRWRDTDNSLRKQKDVDSKRPEIKLLQEINCLQAEKSELEKKLESAAKGKLYYKQQLSRTLQELAKARLREQEQQNHLLHKQQTELEHMRLRYLAAEEQEVMKKDRDALHRTKEGLESLQSAIPSANEHIFMNGGVSNEHAQRLVEERDTLLRTGVYSHDDEIIRELERRIQQALAA